MKKKRVSSGLVPPRQPLSPTSRRRLKQLTDKHGSGKIYQMMSQVVGSRDLDLSLLKGELVAVVSEADSRGDRRRWLVDAGGENQRPSLGGLGADGRELIAEPRGLSIVMG